MRTILLIGLVVGGAFMAGWFTVERDGDRTRIEINKSEIRNDTRHAIDKGRDMLEKREQERLAREQQQGGSRPPGQEPGNWPPQTAPLPGSGVQGAGYAEQSPYGGQPGYGGQSGYEGQPATGRYNANYPVPGGNPAQPPRWSEMPPPWQQQTR